MHTLPLTAIVPTFNRIGPVTRCLESILAQSIPPREVLVVDDGSTDGTREHLAARFPGIRVLSQDNQGVSAARNAGVVAAGEPWLAFCDSDDEWAREKSERQFDFHRRQGYLVTQVGEIWIRHGRRVNPCQHHEKSSGYILPACFESCRITPSAVLLHRSVFERCGLFDPAFRVCEDFELWLRVAYQYPIGLLSEALVVKYGGHEDQLSRTPIPFELERLRALEKFHAAEGARLPPFLRRDLLGAMLRKLEILLSGASKSQGADLASLLAKKASLSALAREEVHA